MMALRSDEAAGRAAAVCLRGTGRRTETVVAALARAAIRNGGGDDAYILPGNRAINNRPDAAVIRKAAG